jgi:hypothetical protein
MDGEAFDLSWLVVALAAGRLRADNTSKKPSKPVFVVIFKCLSPI